MQELRQQYPIAGLLKVAIRTVFERHKGRYGYRRVTAAVRQLGDRVNHKTVQRLMGTLGLKSLVRPKKYRSYKGEVGLTAPNELQRQFEANAGNQKWVTDVTEFQVAGEKLYLSPVLDLYNGEIIAFEMARRPKFELVVSMLRKALAKLRPDEKPMLHSDQGWHYRMPAYQHPLKERQITQSMSRKGNCHDNAVMESFFAVLKSEFFYLNKFSSIDELQVDRIKLKLKGLSPVQFRTQPLARVAA